MQPITVAFATMKGGSGKSTAAICLAGQWHTDRVRVGLLDADPAGTLLRWVSLGNDLTALPAEALGDGDPGEVLRGLSEQGIERLIIDTPGFASEATYALLAQSDIVVIPMRPSPVDYQVAVDTLEQIQTNSGRRPLIRFLLTQAVRGSVIQRHMRDHIADMGHEVLRAELPSRVAFAEAALVGSTPTFIQPSGSAAQDIRAMAREIEGLMGTARGKASG